MIRQAISCDICGTEMLHPNHWFAASDQGLELRVSTWDKRSRLRPRAKHLCGQTCLHKLVDEFTARARNQRTAPLSDKASAETRAPYAEIPRAGVDTASRRSLPPPDLPVVGAAYFDEKSDLESSARLLTTFDTSARSSRAEAWKRERERQRQTPTTSIRRSIA